MPLSVSSFLNRTGCCQNDTYGSPASYTYVSLDGLQSTSTLPQLQTSNTPLGFWLNAYTTIAGLNPAAAGNTTASVQLYLLRTYHNYGVKLLLNAFADEAPISQANSRASQVAQTIIDAVTSGQLDGVSL